MKHLYPAFIALALMASTPLAMSQSRTSISSYPKSKKTDHYDHYFGVKVYDPYRWLEDQDSEETRDWVLRQSQFTQEFLASIPHRELIKKRLTTVWDYEKLGVPFLKNETLFYFKNSGLQNQSVLYFKESYDGPSIELIDPNKFSQDGTVALSNVSVSDDGKYIAYSISKSGSDWKEWKIKEVATQKDLVDHVQWSKFSTASWNHDNTGFYYSRYDEPKKGEEFEQVNYYQKLYFHRVGTEQSEDVLVYERKDKKNWGFAGFESDDGRYLIISISEGTDPKNRLFYKDLQSPESNVVELLNDFDAEYSFLGNKGSRFWFRTDLNAPKGRIIEIDINNPTRSNWKELVAENKSTLRSTSVVGRKFICHYLKDAKSEIQIFNLDGTYDKSINLPGLGSVSGLGGDPDQNTTFYRFTSFNTPGTVYQLDVASGKSKVHSSPELKFDPSNYVTRQVFFESKDGTKIPMFISHRKDLDVSVPNPTYLYGYGGFSISLLPRFSVSNIIWMDMGGIYAQPNLRGGGEYGEEWHVAGTKLKKQNVFDDFHAAAEYLIERNLTTSDLLAIGGGSNGGLLVGACANQRPDLYKVALPAVGVMDMLRFQKFTIGWAWTSDYGSSENSKEEFQALYSYSPYHNLKKGTHYPSILVTTADHDDRVVPAHSFKYAARLQEYHAGDNPVLIRIETKAGHGAGKPTEKIIEEVSDKWAFILSEMGINPNLE